MFFLILDILIILALWITAFAGMLNPQQWGILALAGYALPATIVATFLMLFLHTMVKRKLIIIPFIALITAYQPISLYCPINIHTTDSSQSTSHLAHSASILSQAPLTQSLCTSLALLPEPNQRQSASQEGLPITLLSYNICGWDIPKEISFLTITSEEKKEILNNFFHEQNADILALQEAVTFKEQFNDIYAYQDSIKGINDGSVSVFLYSKYPIIKKESLKLNSKGNVAGAFWLNIKGREVIVINTHLETMGFSYNERTKFGNMIHGNEERDSARATSHTILSKILNKSKIRAQQAKDIHTFITLHKGTPIIVMGDFNDIPQSYTHHTISQGLTDLYREKGFGPGYTFRHFAMRVRIDNILCTKDFNPLSCEVISNIQVSDHQPIKGKIEMF